MDWRPIQGVVEILLVSSCKIDILKKSQGNLFGQGIYLVREIIFLSRKSQGTLKSYACGNHVNSVLLEFRLHIFMDALVLIFQVIPELKKNIKKGEDFVLGK